MLLKTKATVISDLGLTPKDQKPNENGLPKTRPLCKAKRTINGEVSEFVANIMDSAARVFDTKEVISTEEAAYHVN